MNHFVFVAVAASFIFLPVTPGPLPAHGAAMLEDTAHAFKEIRETINDIRHTAGGIARFLESVSSVAGTIARLIDPRALALLFFVLVFSAGFAAIGIPRGRASFFISLALVDALWFVWGRSMNAELPSYALSMAGANLYLLVPYFSYLVLRRRALPAAGRAFAALCLRRAARKPAGREEIRRLARRVDDESLGLVASLSRDAAASAVEEAVSISEESRKRITNLRDALDRLSHTVPKE